MHKSKQNKMPKLIRLVSSQNEIFEVVTKIVKCSGVISIFCQENVNDNIEEALPLPIVSSSILRKILDWAQYHQDDGDAGEAKDITNWDADFLKMDQDTLIDLMAAADYLDIPGLWKLSSQAIDKQKTQQD